MENYREQLLGTDPASFQALKDTLRDINKWEGLRDAYRMLQPVEQAIAIGRVMDADPVEHDTIARALCFLRCHG